MSVHRGNSTSYNQNQTLDFPHKTYSIPQEFLISISGNSIHSVDSSKATNFLDSPLSFPQNIFTLGLLINTYALVQFRCKVRIVLMATLKSTTGQTMIVESNKYGDRPHVAFEDKKWVKDYIKVI